MSLKILTEASGSLVSAYLIHSIKEAGYYSIASDITSDSVGCQLADDFVIMPLKSDENLWATITKILQEKNIKIVIPSFDETLLSWAEHQHKFADMGITIAISNPSVISTFTDKWETYCFFIKNNIPTPKTSLHQDYLLVKPRHGRGGKGIEITNKPINMADMISQEIVTGQEYTVDVFCDKDSSPIYIVPRKRINVRDGKSTQGIVVKHEGIEKIVERICNKTKFIGPINIQCFCDSDDNINVIEINPRVAGGMALGFAATENWIPLIEKTFIRKELIKPKPIQYGLKMMRYYAEIFVS